ncbi:deaminase [Streptosporangium sp. 'caverna']|uniref:deaminase n=1 Tax=Streptosporangium sp. 'caverna' TaxID=2202249 RepID=UPI000D7D64A9|nr:deaminase [Streptosporangium sp. 'caverna']AWS44397.1 nucleoside deaminase [Streptosporangium sp. 'caverna']
MTPDKLVGLAIDVAEEGLVAGELPIGAVVVMGDVVVGRSHTQEKGQGRRIAHAELLTMEEADRRLGWEPRSAPLRLAVNLEPCLMCLGAAMALGVSEIYYGLESPGDGAAGLPALWQPTTPDMPFSHPPKLIGGLRRTQCRAQFARYADTARESGFQRWARTLADLPE